MSWRERTAAFCGRFALRAPILLAPMAGATPPALSIAVARAGGLGACGALVMSPDEIIAWGRAVRAETDGAFQMNLWAPDPPPVRDEANEAKLRAFLKRFGPEPGAGAAEVAPPPFEAQCEALLTAGAVAVSSIMGLFPAAYAARAKARGVAWFATATTQGEAEAAAAAGADAIIAQGMEAGGHRGAFEAGEAERRLVGLFSLLPAVADAVKVPVIAAGGVADGRGAAAALALGASAVMMGSAFLRTPEAGVHPAWAAALGRLRPEDTAVSRAFSGRPGRALRNAYMEAAFAADAPDPAPYPVQRGLTTGMRIEAHRAGDVERMQAWAGQSAGLSRPANAGELVTRTWTEAQALLA